MTPYIRFVKPDVADAATPANRIGASPSALEPSMTGVDCNRNHRGLDNTPASTDDPSAERTNAVTCLRRDEPDAVVALRLGHNGCRRRLWRTNRRSRRSGRASRSLWPNGALRTCGTRLRRTRRARGRRQIHWARLERSIRPCRALAPVVAVVDVLLCLVVREAERLPFVADRLVIVTVVVAVVIVIATGESNSGKR
jgi:hypothetical protein